MPFLTMPDPAGDREHEQARRHPERETLLLAAAGAAQALGPDHGVTKALAKASITMAKVDLWRGSGTTITGQTALSVTTVTLVRVRTPYI